jgi:hypothetical protein
MSAVGQVPDLPRRRRRRTGQVGDLSHSLSILLPKLSHIPRPEELRVSYKFKITPAGAELIVYLWG